MTAAEQIFNDLMLYGNSYIPIPKGAMLANVDSIQVELNTVMVARIKELEAELANAQRLQAIDLATIAKLMLERDELRAELAALAAKLADMPDYYSYMNDDDSPALDYDEWVRLGKPASWLNLNAEQLALANEIERQARLERLRKYEQAKDGE